MPMGVIEQDAVSFPARPRCSSLMAPSSQPRDRQPKHVISIILLKLCSFFFTKSHDVPRYSTASPNVLPTHPPRRRDISRPRQLRRSIATDQFTFSIHPIITLPVEILSLIFEAGAHEDVFFPVTVSHVCRYWRHIVLDSPLIWRRICLDSRGQMWRERLRRAQDCSLDIQLASSIQTRYGTRRTQDLTPYTVNWYMQLVQPYVQQWRSLDINFSGYSPYLWKAAMAACDHPAPLLEELSLIYRLNGDSQEFVPFRGYTPRLRRVTVDGIRLTWTSPSFANLYYLDYTHHGLTSGHQAVHDVISILSVSLRLVELRIMFPRGQIARLAPHACSEAGPIVLPDLKQLHLTSNGSDIPFELAQLVTLMATPNLTTLRLIDLTRSHRSFPSLKSFFYVYALPRSLRFVSIGHGWYNPKMIYAISHSMPHLVSIHVKRSRSPGHVLKMKPQIRQIPSFESSSMLVLVHSSKRMYYIDHVNIHH